MSVEQAAAPTGPATSPQLRWVMGGIALLAVVAAALGIGVAPMPGEHLAVDEPQYWFTALSLAKDGDLDISDELAERRWAQFSDAAPPVETVLLPSGRQISPHDPLLPLLLAVPVAAGGWVGAKLAMALLAGVLAAATVWTAVRRLAVPLPLAGTGVGLAAASAPLAVYGQQLYPELPAALACLLGVAALTGPLRRLPLVLLAAAVVALPWLSVKYTPVAGVLAGLAALRWWRTGQRREVLVLGGALAVAAALYLAAHRVVWGGWTVYASGDYFQDKGEFAVVGVDPDYLARTWRLVGLLVDRDFGLGGWQPGWLLLVPAVAALLARPPRRSDGGRLGAAPLVAPLVAGWLVATFLALTMHGWWWPGRQTVVVLPLALLAVLCWLTRHGSALRTAAAVLGLAGVSSYAALLVEGWAGHLVWVSYSHPTGYSQVNAPVYQVLRPLLPAFRDHVGHLIWAVALTLLAVTAWRVSRVQDRWRRTGPARIHHRE
ncbi:MAG TPA: hypothetical protein VFQ77_07315 [Pseudonocardiaceae bacterium]|jgi:hypothetical protein|nr:hypothetical protein [Pseudonocardiaceae bacterium]